MRLMRHIMTSFRNMSVTDKVAPIKERWVKQKSLKNREKLFKKFKKSKLHIDKDVKCGKI